MNRGIKKQLTSIILLIAIIPVLVVGCISILNMRTIIEAQNKDNCDNAIYTAQNSITELLETCEYTLDYLRELPALKGGLEPKNNDTINAVFKHLKDSNQNIAYYVFALENKTTFSYPQDGMDFHTDLTSREWYQEAIKEKEGTYISEIYNDVITGTAIVTIAKPVYTGNELIGVISCDISLQGVSESFSNFKLGQTGEIIITDPNGAVIASNNKDFIGTNKVMELLDFELLKMQNEGAVAFNQDGAQREGFYGTIEGLGWKVILSQTKEELGIHIKRILTIILVIMVISIIGIILVAIGYSNKVVQAIYKVIELVKHNASGDFTKQVNIKSNNEFEDLGQDLNIMQKNIIGLISNLQNATNHIQEKTHELNDIQTDTNKGITEITEVMHQLSVGAIEIAEKLENLNSEMAQVGEGIDTINQSSEVSQSLTQNTLRLSSDGEKVIEALLDCSSLTICAANNVENSIKHILGSAKKIEDISAYIQNITHQTNLLSLNASIEAARAGEAGKGFAVVAGEIKKMAEETQMAAQNISGILQSISSDINQAVMDVQATNGIIKNQETTTINAKDLFGEIKDSVDKSSGKINQVNRQVEGLQKNKNKILMEVENISAISEEYTASIEEILANCNQLEEKSNGLGKHSSDLKQLNQNLQDSVKKFKI